MSQAIPSTGGDDSDHSSIDDDDDIDSDDERFRTDNHPDEVTYVTLI